MNEVKPEKKTSVTELLSMSLPDAERRSKRDLQKKIVINFIIYSLCYFLVFSGFWGLVNLQSTINAAEGMGDYSMAVLYGCSMFSSLFLPTVFIETFGCKTTLMIGVFSLTVYLATNAFATWESMLAGAAIFGLLNGPYSAAQTFYINEMATRFQSTVTGNVEFIMCLFFGIFTFFSQFTSISGNLISYYALKMDTNLPEENLTAPQECGFHFFPTADSTNPNLDPPTQHQRYVLVGSYVILAFASLFIMASFLASLNNDRKPWTGCKNTFDRVLAAIRLHRNPRQLLLLPFTMYTSMEGQFYANEISQAYIACSWGIHRVGFVTVCAGVCGAVAGLLVGPLVKYTSQMTAIFGAILANLSICLTLVWLKPTPNDPVLFVIAGVWGTGSALWWSQMPALYGLMFPNDREAAFSNLYFWNFTGALMSYSYATSLGFAAKMYILLTFLTLGTIGYLIVTFLYKRSPKAKGYEPQL